jgi:hypothetical protein
MARASHGQARNLLFLRSLDLLIFTLRLVSGLPDWRINGDFRIQPGHPAFARV